MSIRIRFPRVRALLMSAAFVVAVSTLPLPGDVFAQGKGVPKVTDKVLLAKDGVGIAITYYQSTLGKDAPVVIMLHMKGSNRLVWKSKGLAKRLQGFGYAVVTVDLRKHGDSGGGGAAGKKGADLFAADYRAMVAYDLEAVNDFLYEEHQAKRLNMRKTAIVAAEMSCPVAAVYAYRDWLKTPYPDAPVLAARTPRGQTIRAVVFLSPSESALGLDAGLAYHKLGLPLFNVAVLIGYGKTDSVDRGGKKTKGIYKRISAYPGTSSRMYLRDYATKLRGTDMLGRRLNVEKNIINFLDKHVKKLPDQWETRKSRL